MKRQHVYLLKLKWWKFIWKPINKIKFYFWKVKIGTDIITYGPVLIFKKENSIIQIGNHCVFRSKMHSNLIGINRPCSLSTLTKNATIEIGNNCGFSGTVIGAFKSIYIGNNVRCGANTLITDSDWHLNDNRINPKPLPIIIEDNVWLGINVVVMKGVTIGENSIIGANSLVTKNIPPNVIAAGNPCRIIKKINT